MAIYQDAFSDVVLQPFSEYGYRNTIGLILLTQDQVASQQLLDQRKEREVDLSFFPTHHPTEFSSRLASDGEAPPIEVMTRSIVAEGKIDELASSLTQSFFSTTNDSAKERLV